MEKRATTQWTVGKLLTIILVIILIVLIIYGVYSGTLNPLIKKIGLMFDNTLNMLGFRDEKVDGGYNRVVEIPFVGRAEIILKGEWLQEGECKLRLDEKLDDLYGTDFMIRDHEGEEKLHYWISFPEREDYDGHWSVVEHVFRRSEEEVIDEEDLIGLKLYEIDKFLRRACR